MILIVQLSARRVTPLRTGRQTPFMVRLIVVASVAFWMDAGGHSPGWLRGWGPGRLSLNPLTLAFMEKNLVDFDKAITY